MTTTGLPASLLPTLAGRYYTDPAVFAAEQAAIFEPLWFCALRSADLSGPGQFRTVQVGRESVIVVRAGDGRLAQVAEEQDRRYYAITVRPQMFVGLVPDRMIAHRMFPLAPDRTIVEGDWLFARDVVDAGQDLSPSVELFDRVNRQDFDACERCQPAMSSRGYAKGGVLVPSEHHIGAVHDWLRGMLGEPAPM